MLDTGQDAPAREALANEAKGQIESGGTLKHENNWGLRKLAYEIKQRTEADYRWFRFEAPPTVLEQLDHNLKIADGVLRFRIYKVDPDAPVIAPPATSAPVGARERSRDDSSAPRQAAPAAPAQEPASEPAQAEAAPAPAEAESAPAEAEPAPAGAEPAGEPAPSGDSE